ncbi:MAG: glycosyltransferase family 2 protein [Fermentimonas sp.]|nr:glycosyltransferase family 2 protein [Fermentimonas sp.]
MNNKPLLSIVVPTKNRYKYLKHLIELIDNFDTNKIELVIQDNTKDNKEILNFINENSYSFMKYSHCEENISVGENFDLGILNSSGKFVIGIGDDDGLSRNIINYVEWMDENNIDSFRPQVVVYKWPSVKGYKFDFSSQLQLKKPTKTIKYIFNFDKIRKTVLNKGATTLHNLPRVYYGIIRRRILDQVYETTNTFFPGPSPDMASSIALSFYVKKHVIFDVPIVIAGHSPKSAGGLGTAHNHISKINEVPWLPTSTEKYWERFIPKYWTGQTIYAETAIKALRALNKENEIKHFNYAYLYGSILSFDPVLLKSLKQFINYKNIIPIFFYYSKIMLVRARIFASNLLKKYNIKSNNIVVKNIYTIEECESYLFKKSLNQFD